MGPELYQKAPWHCKGEVALMGTYRSLRSGLIVAAVLGAFSLVAACSPGGATPSATSATAAPATATPSPSATPAATVSATPTAAPTATPAPTAQAATLAPPAAVPTITTHHISTHAANNSWKAEFDEPVVGGVSAAGTMNTAIDAKVQGWITDIGKAGYNPSILTGKYSVALLSKTLISIRFAVSEDAGGAHPINYVDGISFTVSSGATIQFSALFGNATSALAVLNPQTLTLLTALVGGAPSWSPATSLTKVSTAWTMTTVGLELSWNQGTVADEAAGPVTITIPWSALAGVVSPSGPAAQLLP